MRAYFDLNSMLLTIEDLRNARTGAEIVADSDVDVTAKILAASDGAEVADSEITLEAVDDSPGEWQGVFPATLALTRGVANYVVSLTADGGAYLTGHWELPITVRSRQ